jgi:hypothetical protein
MNDLRTKNGAARRARTVRAGGLVHAGAVAVICQRTAGFARQHTTRKVAAVVSCCTLAGEASTPGPELGRGLGSPVVTVTGPATK